MKAKELCAKQAWDGGLWFVAKTAPEAYLQAALRELHAAIDARAVQTTLEPHPPSRHCMCADCAPSFEVVQVEREHITDGSPCWCNPTHINPETGLNKVVQVGPRSQHPEASKLLYRATKQLDRWSTKYGDWKPEWLPPAGDIELAEDIEEYLARKAVQDLITPNGVRNDQRL